MDVLDMGNGKSLYIIGMSHDEIMDKYSYAMCMAPHVDKALAPAMGDQAYIARFRTEEERDEFLYDTCNRA